MLYCFLLSTRREAWYPPWCPQTANCWPLPTRRPRAIIRVDSSPGFQSMSNNDSLNHLNVTIEVGRLKNKNTDPVASSSPWAWGRSHPTSQSPVASSSPWAWGRSHPTRTRWKTSKLAQFASLSPPFVSAPVFVFLAYHLANCRLNAISSPTNSCRYLITTSYLTNTNIVPLTMPLVRSPRSRRLVPNTPPLQVGDIVYFVSDKDNSRARDR